MDTSQIDRARQEIDRINGELTALLVERMKQVDIVGEWKKANDHPIFVPAREEAILKKVTALAGEEFAPEIKAVFEAVFEASRRREERLKKQSGE